MRRGAGRQRPPTLDELRDWLLEGRVVEARQGLLELWDPDHVPPEPVLDRLRTSLDLATIYRWPDVARRCLDRAREALREPTPRIDLHLEALEARLTFGTRDLEAGEHFFEARARDLEDLDAWTAWLSNFRLASLLAGSRHEEARTHLAGVDFSSLSPTPHDRAIRTLLLASALEGRGRWARARRLHARATAMFARLRGPEARFFGSLAATHHAHLLGCEGRTDEALDLLDAVTRTGARLWMQRLLSTARVARNVILRQEGLPDLRPDPEPTGQVGEPEAWIEALDLLNSAWFIRRGRRPGLASRLLKAAEQLIEGTRPPVPVRILLELVRADRWLPERRTRATDSTGKSAARRALERARSLLEKTGGGSATLRVMWLLGEAAHALESGDLERARERATEGLELAERGEQGALAAQAVLLLSQILLRSGEVRDPVYRMITGRILELKCPEVALRVNANLYLHCFDRPGDEQLTLQDLHMRLIGQLEQSLPPSRYLELKQAYLIAPMLPRLGRLGS